jgi:hypothetical protein
VRPENSQEVHRIKIPATLHQNGRSWAVCTGFVGYRGVILWTDTLPTSEQLLKVTIPMVPGEPPFCAHAVPRRLPGIAHLGNALAVGLGWYALDPASNDRWQRFVRQVGQRYPQARTHLVDLSPDDAPDPVRRRASRDRQRFRVKFALGDRVVWCDTLDVSATGMFLVTPEVVPVGTHLKAELSLAGTKDRWRITMVVRRLGPPAVPGLGVELLEKTRI